MYKIVAHETNYQIFVFFRKKCTVTFTIKKVDECTHKNINICSFKLVKCNYRGMIEKKKRIEIDDFKVAGFALLS